MSPRFSIPRRWVQAGVCIGIVMLVVALLLPAIQQSRAASRKAQAKWRLKDIGLALETYHESYRMLPHGGIFDEHGTAFHGWDTALLLYLSQRAYYDVGDSDFPWDDPVNVEHFLHERTSSWQFPGIFAERSPDGLPLTHMAASQTLFHRNSVVRLDNLPEKSGVAMIGEARGNFVPIGYPYNWRDLSLGLGASDEGFGSPIRDTTMFVMGDLSVREFANDTSAAILKDLAGQIQPLPRAVKKPAGPYRLTVRDYWRYLNVVRGHKQLMTFRLSPDRKNLYVDFRYYDDYSEAIPERWDSYFHKFLQAAPVETVHLKGRLRARELQPFLKLPKLKRLTISDARIEDDPKEFLAVAPKSILVD